MKKNQIGQEKLKVALIAAPYVAIPPEKYGGAERRIDALSRGLIKRGVDFTLFASGDSRINVPLEKICDFALSSDPSYDHQKNRLIGLEKVNNNTLSLLKKSKYDIINLHDYENPLLTEKLSKLETPILVSLRHSMSLIMGEVYHLFKDTPNIYFHGVSQTQINEINPKLKIIPNGEDSSIYEPVKNVNEKRNYFFSIGAMKPIKGHKIAIDLSKILEMDMVLSSDSLSFYESSPYFEKYIKNKIDLDVSKRKEIFLDDLAKGKFNFGKGRVINFGPSNNYEKAILFKHAGFTQFLGKLEVDWAKEASPGVIIESLLSGTPILGVKNSVTDEMVKDNITGINVLSLEEVKLRKKELLDLNPLKIREVAVKDYSSERMVDDYINFYNQILKLRQSVN